MPKKPPYTGDPNATMTMCYKKMRRHLPIDLVFLPVPVEVDPADGGELTADKPKVEVVIFCRHCGEFPIIQKE